MKPTEMLTVDNSPQDASTLAASAVAVCSRSAPPTPKMGANSHEDATARDSEGGREGDEERKRLFARVVQLNDELENEREIRAELEAAKRALVNEVEELSQALFEEAGSMVANEAKARAAIEHSRIKLERELAETKERLGHQTTQLEELRSRIQSMSISALDTCTDNSTCDGHIGHNRKPLSENPLPGMFLQNVRTYCEVLFPEQKFSSRKRSQHHPQLWAPVLDDIIMSSAFREFADFVEKITRLPDSDMNSITWHPYYKAVVDGEAETALHFPCKSATFPNRVVVSMLANECIIERIQERHSGFDSNSGGSSNNGDEMPFAPISPSTDSSLITKLTSSVTSLPDTLIGGLGGNGANSRTNSTYKATYKYIIGKGKKSKSAQTSPIPSPSKQPPQPLLKCTLCNSQILPFHPKWRMRLSPRERQWRLMDDRCRDRLVSVGDFCAFLRHLRAGLHSARPLVDLFAEQLHHRRNIFYCRSNSLPFFLVSDFEQFWRRIGGCRVGSGCTDHCPGHDHGNNNNGNRNKMAHGGGDTNGRIDDGNDAQSSTSESSFLYQEVSSDASDDMDHNVDGTASVGDDGNVRKYIIEGPHDE